MTISVEVLQVLKCKIYELTIVDFRTVIKPVREM